MSVFLEKSEVHLHLRIIIHTNIEVARNSSLKAVRRRNSISANINYPAANKAELGKKREQRKRRIRCNGTQSHGLHWRSRGCIENRREANREEDGLGSGT